MGKNVLDSRLNQLSGDVHYRIRITKEARGGGGAALSKGKAPAYRIRLRHGVT